MAENCDSRLKPGFQNPKKCAGRVRLLHVPGMQDSGFRQNRAVERMQESDCIKFKQD
jgi:hypothetical protein